MAKPMKKSRRFAEGDLVTNTTNVRTRSDDEIGDTNPRTGVYTPGSYDARQKAGESNLNAVKGLWNRITGGSSDDSGTGTRGIKAAVSDTKYEPTKSSVADYIGKSTEPKSAESKSSGFNSSSVKGTSAFGDYSGTSKSDDSGSKSSAPETKPSSKLPITIEGDYPKKSAGVTESAKKDEEVTESVKKADPKIDEAIKKKKAAAAAKAKADAEAEAKSDRRKAAEQKIKKHAEESKKSKEDRRKAQGDDRVGIPVPISDVFSGADKSKDPHEKMNRAKNAMEDQIRDTMGSTMKRGGAVKKMASGGSVKSSASSRGDGIASRGKTRGKIY